MIILYVSTAVNSIFVKTHIYVIHCMIRQFCLHRYFLPSVFRQVVTFYVFLAGCSFCALDFSSQQLHSSSTSTPYITLHLQTTSLPLHILQVTRYLVMTRESHALQVTRYLAKMRETVAVIWTPPVPPIM